ncbi:MAG TPA: PQQ-like beta-propeller repeat protein [Candidatus Paceibacterota bacterium]|nr:PQQ-like beta-propeller repeat protein [Verrucomicrobiota bacterium]HRY51686.1 PQQ-like beta-propeller repeat protein [Candidatus Paceibacterota bacterium]
MARFCFGLAPGDLASVSRPGQSSDPYYPIQINVKHIERQPGFAGIGAGLIEKRPAMRLFSTACYRLAIVWLGLVGFFALADDWPQWRGLNRDGVWREDGILETFPTKGLMARWRVAIGAGFSGPAVANGRVFLMDRRTEEAPDTEVKTSWDFRDKTVGMERVLAVDEASGKILWVHSYPCKYSAAYGSGPRATPTVRDDRVYTLGTMGDLLCLESATGKVVWRRNLVQDYGAKVPLYGYAIQPLVDGDRLILLVGGTGQAVVAFDRHNGRELWRALDAVEPGYSAPLIHPLGGQRQLIVWHAGGLAGLVPETGELRWFVPHPVNAGLAITTPTIESNRLAVSSQYEGALMMEFKPGKADPEILWKASTGGAPEREWKKQGFNTTLSTVLLKNNYLYGVSLYGEMCCLDGNSGSRVWTTLAPTSGGTKPKERWCTVFMVTHRDRVLIFNELGDLILCRLSAKGYEEISRAHLLEPDMDSSGGGRQVVWSHPAFANRCVYARNNRELICVSLAAQP